MKAIALLRTRFKLAAALVLLSCGIWLLISANSTGSNQAPLSPEELAERVARFRSQWHVELS